MLHQLDKLGKAVANLFLPQFCLGCGREGEALCCACLARMPRLSGPYCARCGLPQNDSGPCRDCSVLDLTIDGIRSPLRFERLTREAIHQFKYQNIRALALPLARLLNDYLIENRITAEVLVPVPLHPRRLRERGYNQSSLLACELSKMADIPIAGDVLVRRFNTPPQARTSGVAERHRNLQGAFACVDGKLKDKQVLLIDDVSTSGATLNACAVALKQAGAASVWGLTVAREV